jgi:hypothetical protein
MRRGVSEAEQKAFTTNKPVKVGNQELFHASAAPDEPEAEAEGPIATPKKSSLIFVLLFGAAIVACLGVIAATQRRPESAPNIPPDADDLGQGVASASGLRGHLVTRWQKGKTQYMLKIEPLDPRDAQGFSAVSANPSKPISINIRLLDSAGFALCGKEIDMHFDPAARFRTHATEPKKQADPSSAFALMQAAEQEKEREDGKDVFQNIQATDGSVEALWAQGELPCSPDQYKRFDYWDLSTNFPTLAEQDQILGHPHGQAQEETASATSKGKHKPAHKAPVSSFYMEGDDRATAYEPARSLLVMPGRSFYIPGKSDQTTVADWAADSALIHFKCDQQENCSLRTGSHAVYGRVNN